MEDIRNTLVAVVNALNNIETKGYQNISNLLGCINILQEMIANMNKETPPEEE